MKNNLPGTPFLCLVAVTIMSSLLTPPIFKIEAGGVFFDIDQDDNHESKLADLDGDGDLDI